MMIRFLLALIVGVGVVWGAEEKAPGRPKLMVGDPAPAIKVGKWIQGEPISNFEKGKVYVVEFWASWCGPCKVSIPHLNELYLKFKDQGLVVMGVAIREDEPKDAIKALREMGKKMTYRVALDDLSEGEPGRMDLFWMRAVERDQVPKAFVVKEGVVVWIGNPIDMKEELVKALLSPNFDVKAEAARYARKLTNAPKLEALSLSFEQAVEKKEYEKAEELIAERLKLVEPEDRSAVELELLDLKLKQEDMGAAEKLAKELDGQNKDEILFHDALAWTILIAKTQTPALMAVAESSANLANKIGEGKDTAVLETMGRLLLMKGDRKGAVAAVEKAMGLVDPQSRTKVRLERQRDAYKKGELPSAR